jgi:hypothetical protein
MKKILLAVILLTLASCREPNVKNERTEYVIRAGSNPLTIVTIDGCQYLYGDWGNATVLTHKGNCNNSIHKFKSE